MINFANKSFSNTGAIAAFALEVALLFSRFREGLDFVSGRDYRGLLADDAGYLNAVFMNNYGSIGMVPLSASLFTEPLEDIEQREVVAKLERERRDEIRGLENEIIALESELETKRWRYRDLTTDDGGILFAI